MTDKQKQRVNKKAVKAFSYLELCEKCLMTARESVSMESPEYALIGNAIGSIRDSKSDCGILVRRTKDNEN